MMPDGSNSGVAGFGFAASCATSGDVMVVASCFSSSSRRRIVAVTASEAGTLEGRVASVGILRVLSALGEERSALAGASLAMTATSASFNAGNDGMESSVTSIGPSSNSPVDIGAGAGRRSADSAAAGAAGAAGAGGATAPAGSGMAVTGSAFAAIDATFSAGRVPVSPASRFANVSSLSAGTSMVSGITRGAEMRSMETMM